MISITDTGNNGITSIEDDMTDLSDNRITVLSNGVNPFTGNVRSSARPEVPPARRCQKFRPPGPHK